MKKLLVALLCICAAAASGAAEQVWRYVDAHGQVTYSNVQIKGLKGERVEILSQPAPRVSKASAAAPSAEGGPAPIPPEILQRLQGQRPAERPNGLPPLPGAGAAAPTAPARAQGPESGSAPEPKWAKEVAAEPAPQPAWARDPFSQR